jgi:ornithine cyclodeaminase/alanine dehydrogenase-like protein (mu-crystallin family)
VSELLVLGHDEVKRLLPMDECVELMENVLADVARGSVWQPLRFVIRPPEEPSLMGLMPAHRAGPAASYGLKVICIFPSNAERGLDLHQGGVLLFDGETGALRALLDASAVTAVRTAAVSGVATRLLARKDARRLAILGAGVQARSHLDAMAVAGEFEDARVWTRTPERAAAFAAEAQAPFPVEAVESAEEALRDADVVVTATTAKEPIVQREWLAPGTHVNAVGSSIPTTRELDAETVAASALFADARESMVNEGGDYLFAVREAGIGPDHIRAELGEILIGSGEGRRSDDELTVFKSLGLAAEDLAAAEHVYARALAEGAGTSVPF